MKRMMFTAVSAVAAAAAFAVPANAQIVTTKPIGDSLEMTAPCLTPVTKCVDQYADYAVAVVMGVYDAAGNLIQDPPPIGEVCKLIWEEGCGTDAIPF